MRIAMITDYYLPTLGGVQTSVKAQKEALESKGHVVFIYCPLHDKSLDETIIRVPTSKKFKPDNFPFAWSPRSVEAFLTQSLRALAIDVVHVQSEMVAAVCGVKVARKLGIPLVQSMHGRLDVYTHKVLPVPTLTTRIVTEFHKRYIPLDHSVVHAPYAAKSSTQRIWKLMVSQANAAHQVIVPSQHFANKLKVQGVTKPVSVLSNGLENTVLRTAGTPAIRTYKKEEIFQIMWCGRVSPEKRPLEFLEAIGKVDWPIQVNLYGDGMLLGKLKDYIHKHKLEDRVTLHGSVTQAKILEAMKRSHLFVSTSYDFDNQPMVFLECIAAGTPLLFCDPDLAEIVPQSGYVCSPSPEIQDIASAIESIVNDPESIEFMSAQLLAYKQHVTQSKHTAALVHIYRAAIKTQSKQLAVQHS